MLVIVAVDCVLASSFGTRVALTNAATRRKPDDASSDLAASVDRTAAVAVGAAGVGTGGEVVDFGEVAAGVLAAAAITIFARAVAARAAATVAATVGSALEISTLCSLSSVGVGEATARLLVHE